MDMFYKVSKKDRYNQGSASYFVIYLKKLRSDFGERELFMQILVIFLKLVMKVNYLKEKL